MVLILYKCYLIYHTKQNLSTLKVIRAMVVEQDCCCFCCFLFLETHLVLFRAICNVKPGIVYDYHLILVFHVLLLTYVHPIVPHQLLLTAQFSPLSSVLINTISF